MVSLSQQQQQQQQYTLGFLKPDVMDRKTEILELIKAKSLWNLRFEKELSLSFEDAKLLYSQDDIATWLSSHSIYVFILKGPNVVKNWYKYAGPKDSMKAKQISPQSLRAIYGLDDIQNVCHASSSDKEAQRDLTWLQNLLPDYRLSMPLDTGSASLSEQRNQGAPTKPTSTNIAASTFNPNQHPAAPISKYLLTTSDPLSPSSLSSLPGLKKKQFLTKQPMALSRPNPSLATPSKELKPATQVNLTSQSQKPNTLKYPLSKTTKIQTARQETKTPRSKDRLVPLTDKSSSDSAKAMGYNNIKRLSNSQGLSKINPGISVSPKQQSLQPRKLSQMEKHQKDTVKADNNNNNTHTQPQQLKDNIESEKCGTSSPQSSKSNNSNTLGNEVVESPVALSPPNNGNGNGNAEHYHHHQSIHDETYPTTTASSSSSHSNISLVSSTSTLTVDNDHHDKEEAVPLSTTVSPIRVVVSPTTYPIHRHAPPDVDNLRHEFEALCQNKQAMVAPRTPYSTTTSPYLASRIKDLKPKNPSGSRVKSMVDFFMDENLHKWEF